MLFRSIVQPLSNQEIEIEIDIDKEKKTKKENPLFKAFSSHTYNQELITALKDFNVMRNKIKKPLTERAVTLLLNKLSRYTEEEQIAMLNESVINSWQSVYEPKGGAINNGTSNHSKTYRQAVSEYGELGLTV